MRGAILHLSLQENKSGVPNTLEIATGRFCVIARTEESPGRDHPYRRFLSEISGYSVLSAVGDILVQAAPVDGIVVENLGFRNWLPLRRLADDFGIRLIRPFDFVPQATEAFWCDDRTFYRPASAGQRGGISNRTLIHAGTERVRVERFQFPPPPLPCPSFPFPRIPFGLAVTPGRFGDIEREARPQLPRRGRRQRPADLRLRLTGRLGEPDTSICVRCFASHAPPRWSISSAHAADARAVESTTPSPPRNRSPSPSPPCY